MGLSPAEMDDTFDAITPPSPVAAPAVTVSPLPPGEHPKHIARMLSEPATVGTRSERSFALITAAFEWGYDDAQILDLARRHAPSVDKFGGRIEAEVARVVDKASAGGARGWKRAELDAERKALRVDAQGIRSSVAPDVTVHRLGLRPVSVIASEVDAMPAPRWLFRGVWPCDAHGVLAARWKAGKTWAMLDAAVSVASGTPWLGLFPTDTTGPVVMFLGEGGARKMTRRGRAVADARGITWDDLPILLAERVPRLSDPEQMAALADQLDQHPAALVIIDPLYLAAGGANASKLYEMGEVLGPVQEATQGAGAALMLAHHDNRDKSRTGSERMSGAGPAEWGRVLASVAATSSRTDGAASDVTLELSFEGDEITGGQHHLRRRVWAEDPDDLGSPLHYVTEAVERRDTDDTGPTAGLAPSRLRVLDVLTQQHGRPVTVRAIGDALADDGHGAPLKVRTIQSALTDLADRDLVDAIESPKGGTWEWATRTEGEDDDGRF